MATKKRFRIILTFHTDFARTIKAHSENEAIREVKKMALAKPVKLRSKDCDKYQSIDSE